MQTEKVIAELNAYLKGENMAIESYDQFIAKLNDEKVKKEFQRIQMDHKEHSSRIAARIQTLGGRPVDGIGMMGSTALAINSLKGITHNDTSQIVMDAYTGEDRGIQMAEEIIKGDLDDNSRLMIHKILEEDRAHLELLKSINNTGHNS